MLRNKLTTISLVLLMVAGTGIAAAKSPEKIAWISPKNPYGNYLEAAVQKKHTPVLFTTIKSKADLWVSIQGRTRKGSTWRAVFTGNSGRASALSMTVVNAKSGIVVFSYTCHKGGHGFFQTGHQGFQSAAECLAKHWKDKLQ